jgi:catechol 2,3-dioxygenase-like lactoylglutathione lyase family enzyme
MDEAAVVGLRHVHLKVHDVEQSARFYERALGLERALTKYGGAMVILTVPGAGDALTLSDERVNDGQVDGSHTRVGDNGGIDHFGFTLADQRELDAAVDRVLDAGGTLVSRTELGPGFPTAFVRDIDGYAFQL